MIEEQANYDSGPPLNFIKNDTDFCYNHFTKSCAVILAGGNTRYALYLV